tara:strand:- start:474 stop:854 length:381 start_codon:yes stop_codon:yes gene_type:complete
MFKNAKTTVSQGAVGVAAAIFNYQRGGYNVSIPLIDNQGYDLIIEKNGKFLSVQVKTTKSAKNESFIVQIKRVRPNKTKNVILPLEKCDLVFILCSNGDAYSIPYGKITTTSELRTKSFTKYKIAP